MPRPAKPPRLYLRERAGREAMYVILDARHEQGTGCGPGREREAEKAFGEYLASKHAPKWGDGDPARIPVADVLKLYADEKAPTHAHPELVSFHIPPLLTHFGEMSCWDVTESTCIAYVARRTAGKDFKRPVKVATARRELVTLGAALQYAYKARKISKPVLVSLPDQPPSKDRFLTRREAAALLAAALGFRAGKPRTTPSYHVARFILIALYTGTRHEAVLKLRWGVNSAGGWFDLARGVVYRRGNEERVTRKRRTPAPISARLLPHLERWRRLTTIGPCEYDGRLTQRQKTGFARAVRNAGLGADVTPHVLKHTCVTWLLQAGVSTWEVAGYVGTSEAVIRNTYGHHAADSMTAAKSAFHGRIMGNGRKAG